VRYNLPEGYKYSEFGVVSGTPIWELERIVHHRPVSVQKGSRRALKFEYKVKWVGLPQVEDEYLSERDCVGEEGLQAIRKYWNTLGLELPSHQK